MWRIIYTWWAILDGITHAAQQIRPGQVLTAMCITAFLCYCAMPFLMRLVDLLPMFRKRRIAEQNQRLKDEAKDWQAECGRVTRERDEYKEKCEAQERIIAMEKNANRNFNAEAAQLVRR